MLARFKFLRGTAFDPFGHSEERKLERELIAEYEATVDLLIKELKPSNYATAVALAELPEQIRGYGPVKERALAKVREQEKQLRNRLTGGEIKVLNLFDPAA